MALKLAAAITRPSLSIRCWVSTRPANRDGAGSSTGLLQMAKPVSRSPSEEHGWTRQPPNVACGQQSAKRPVGTTLVEPSVLLNCAA
jgi:hypothetical protein